MARARDDRGSVVLALVVVMVMAALAVAVTDRTVSDLRSARLEQDRAVALAALDVAVADAGERLEMGAAATFTSSGTAGAATWSYTAVPLLGATATVTVTATAGRATRGAVATFVRQLDTSWRLTAMVPA